MAWRGQEAPGVELVAPGARSPSLGCAKGRGEVGRCRASRERPGQWPAGAGAPADAAAETRTRSWQ